MLGLELLLLRLGLSLALNGLGVLLAVLKNHLKFPTGALAALFLGVGLFTFNPFAWLLLLAFFISSSFLTKFKAPLKVDVQEKFEKGSQRDIGQVFANGLPPVFYVILLTVFSISDLRSPLFIAVTTYFAAANADTFSTEIGILAKSPPRWILDLRRTVEKGTSGGVTLLGTLAGALGSLKITSLLLIGVYLVSDLNRSPHAIFIALNLVFLGGLLGSIIDSLLGASIQGFYFCPSCQIETEKRVHLKCGGTETHLVRGWKSITNDWVNLVSATTASLLAGFVCFLVL